MGRFSKEEIKVKVCVIDSITQELLRHVVSSTPPVYRGPIDERHDLQALVTEIGGYQILPPKIRKRVKTVVFAKEGKVNSICPKPEVRQRGLTSPDYQPKDLLNKRLAKSLFNIQD